MPAAMNSSGCRPATRKISRIWNECVALSRQEFEAVYRILDIHYDIQRGESFYNDRLPAVVDRLLKSGRRGNQRRRGLRFLPRHSRAGRAAVHRSEKRRRFQLRHDRHRHRRLSHQRLKARTRSGMSSARRRRLHFKQIFEIARREGYHCGFSPHSVWQHPRRGPQADENALGRQCAAARSARRSRRPRAQNRRQKRIPTSARRRRTRSRRRSASARSNMPISRSIG